MACFDINFAPIPSIRRSHPGEADHPLRVFLMLWRRVRPIYP
jgi:hypothetical protein